MQANAIRTGWARFIEFLASMETGCSACSTTEQIRVASSSESIRRVRLTSLRTSKGRSNARFRLSGVSETEKDIRGFYPGMEIVLITIRLVIVSAGVLLSGCAELDKGGVADPEGSSFGDSQGSLPSAQVKLPVRKGQPLPAGRYGRPATRIAPEGT